MRVHEVHWLWKVYLDADAEEYFWRAPRGEKFNTLGLRCEKCRIDAGRICLAQYFAPKKEANKEKH